MHPADRDGLFIIETRIIGVGAEDGRVGDLELESEAIDLTRASKISAVTQRTPG